LIQQRAFEFNPLVVIGKSLLQLSMMSLPVTNQKVEVMKTWDCTFYLIHPGSRTLLGSRGQLSGQYQIQD
jgi:hypothetical protein